MSVPCRQQSNFAMIEDIYFIAPSPYSECSRSVLFDEIEQLKDAHIKRICNYLNCIQRWVGLSVFDTA